MRYELKESFLYHCVTAVLLGILTWLIYYFGKIPVGSHFVSTWFLASLFVANIVAFFISIFTDAVDFDLEYMGYFGVWALTWSALAILILIIWFFNGALFHGATWRSYISTFTTEINGDDEFAFQEYIQEGNQKNLPIFGQDEAQTRGETLLASDINLSSRFALDTEWTSQEIDGQLVYVNEFEPQSVFRWNSSQGNHGYITVNRSTGEAEKVEDTLYYTVEAPFDHNARRIMRNEFPHMGITEVTPEIDEEGNFYYVGTTYKYAGLSGLPKVTGVITLDSKSGDCKWYSVEDAPEWIDRIYPESIFLEYVRIYGLYNKGTFNRLFAKEGVMTATEGLDVVYDTESGDCYYYTGYSGEGQANSSTGIVMMNARTGQIIFYKSGENGGISERRAQTAAEGKVADFGYSASYPLLLNVAGEKSMFMLMHSEDHTLMGYAFVSYTDASKVAFGTTLTEARTEYLKVLAQSSSATDLTNEIFEDVTGTIRDIIPEVLDGNTVYVVRLEGREKIYIISPEIAPTISFAKPEDRLEIKYTASEAQRITAVEVIHTAM